MLFGLNINNWNVKFRTLYKLLGIKESNRAMFRLGIGIFKQNTLTSKWLRRTTLRIAMYGSNVYFGFQMLKLSVLEIEPKISSLI